MARSGKSRTTTDPGAVRRGAYRGEGRRRVASRRSPVPVEAVGDAMREAHARHRLARDVGRIEEEEVARVPLVVVDEDENVAVVLAGVRVAGDEDRLADAVRRAEPAHRGRPALEVVSPHVAEVGQRAVDLRRGAGRDVAEAVLAADAALVDARKLGTHVVERLRPDPAGAEVDPPAVQVRLVLPPVAG